MINYQLPNALPLANSGKGMNYPEQHPKREPTMKESQKRYLAVSTDSSSQTGLLAPSERGAMWLALSEKGMCSLPGSGTKPLAPESSTERLKKQRWRWLSLHLCRPFLISVL